MARAVEPHKDAVAGTGTAWPRCRLVCPQSFPLGLGTGSPWARVARRRKAGGEEEEDARRTFEAGPERPLGVIDDGLPLGPWYLSAVHPLAAWQAGQAGGEESKDQACRGLPSCIP